MRGLALAAAVSVTAHGALVLMLPRHGLAEPGAPATPVFVEVREAEKPAPPAPKPIPPPPARRRPAVARRTVAAVVKPAAPPAKPPPVEAPPPPPVPVGINADSVSEKGTFSVPVGETLAGVVPTIAPAPVSAPASAPPPSPAPVPISRVTAPPVLLSDALVPYPPAARAAGVSGEVVMLLTIDERGAVARAKVIEGPGKGLDQAALEAARRFRFSPARCGDKPVATVIRYVYAFHIV